MGGGLQWGYSRVIMGTHWDQSKVIAGLLWGHYVVRGVLGRGKTGVIVRYTGPPIRSNEIKVSSMYKEYMVILESQCNHSGFTLG